MFAGGVVMDFVRTKIPDVVLCEPKIHADHRGFFFESYRKDSLSSFLGYDVSFCQDNISKSQRGVLRGLHFQVPPFAQSKLIRVVEGEVLDVAVDIRKGSPSFGKHVAVELSEHNNRSLFVPRGFAHGFIVLSQSAVLNYKVDQYYNSSSDSGIRFDDPCLSIDWRFPQMDLKLSAKDAALPYLKDCELFDFSTNYYI